MTAPFRKHTGSPFSLLLLLLLLTLFSVEAQLRPQRQQQQQQKQTNAQQRRQQETNQWPVTTTRLAPNEDSDRDNDSSIVEITSVQMVDAGELVLVAEHCDVHVSTSGMIVMEGNEARFRIPSGNLYLDGLLNVVLEEHGTQDSISVQGELFLEGSARFSIDASSFAGAKPDSTNPNQVSLPLVSYSSHSGSFSPQQVIIMGLQQDWTAEVVTGETALDLILTKVHQDASKPDEQDAVDYRTAYLIYSQASQQDTNRRFHAL